jgi:polyphenol oxidase
MKRLIFNKNDGYYSFDFDDVSVMAVFSNKRINMAFNENDRLMTLTNREKFSRAAGFNHKDLVCFNQVHGDRIVEVGLADKGRGTLDPADDIKETDAAITGTKGIPLSIRTADCLSLFFYDRRHKKAGIAHAGWKGTKAGMAGRLISLMREKYASDPADILVGMGPALKSCCYEVGDEFRNFFPAYLTNREGKLYFDIVKANYDQLVTSGIKADNIIDSGLCTACLPDKFFSWRREKTADRMLSVIMLK